MKSRTVILAAFVLVVAALGEARAGLGVLRGPGAWLASDTIPPVPGVRDTIPGLPRPAAPPAAAPGDTVPPRAPGDTAGADTTRRSRLEGVQDSTIAALLRLEGYVPVEYVADSAEFRNEDRTLRLRGDPEVRREGNTIVAEDSIVYRERSDFVAAYGRPRGDPAEGEEIAGDVFYYDLAGRRATVRGARTRITQGATWYVHGDVTDERGERVYASNSTFTSDDRENPAYYFRAEKIMVIRDRILVGRPAVLYFRNVPVVALPFIVQDLERGRRSGVLIPEFEINDIVRTNSRGRNSRGTGREISNIGYYWALNQYMGMQVAGRWRSESYTALAGNLDFNWRRRFLNGGLRFERFWRVADPSTLTLSGSAAWNVNERTDLRATLSYASSSRFERDRTIDPTRQVADLNSTAAFNRRFDWGSLALSAERRQSIAQDETRFSPSVQLSINPVNILPGVVMTPGFSASRSTTTFGEALERRQQSTEEGNASATLGLQLGPLNLSGSAAYSLSGRDALAGIDTALAEPGTTLAEAKPLPGVRNERLSTSFNTSYQIPLIASTRLSPSVGFSQEWLRRDTTAKFIPGKVAGAYGEWIAAPARLNVGASLDTDLYGFFPGFGSYSAIRHHVKPSFTYTYSPAVGNAGFKESPVTRQLFGALAGRTVNRVQVGLAQTFEAKLRETQEGDPVRADSMADSARSAGNAARPSEPRKVTLLAINTSAVSYSFVDVDTLGRRFEQEEISNTVRSDLLGGFNFTMTHDLFDDEFDERGRVRRGGFSPFLTSFNTSLSFGQNSAIFRWLGFARATEPERAVERGRTPDTQGTPPITPTGPVTATGNTQQAGGGPWNASVTYSLTRDRRSVTDTLPGTFDRGNQSLQWNLSFYPTRNWAVSWNTEYSLTEGEFARQVLNLKRDLYRWQANFGYVIAPNGNTAFQFSVHLIDLPDLKADYDQSNLGVDRIDTGPTTRDRR